MRGQTHLVVSTGRERLPHLPSPTGWEVELEIGGVGVHLVGHASASARALAARFGAFVAEGVLPQLTVQVQEHAPNLEGGAPPQGSLCASDAGWRALIDLEARHALVAGPAAARGVEAVLRLALPYLLGPGLLLHAVLLAHGGRGFLGVGPSGCGKTTLARLLPDQALGDELAVANRRNGRWTVGAFPTPGARGGVVPLEGIFFLHPAPTHQRRPVAASRAAALLAGQTHWPTDHPEAGRHTFHALAHLAASVPCWELGFARERSVLELVVGGE